ncbi:MAG: hypothetical protein WHS87_03330 [Anaerolineales bacterium]
MTLQSQWRNRRVILCFVKGFMSDHRPVVQVTFLTFRAVLILFLSLGLNLWSAPQTVQARAPERGNAAPLFKHPTFEVSFNVPDEAFIGTANLTVITHPDRSLAPEARLAPNPYG